MGWRETSKPRATTSAYLRQGGGASAAALVVDQGVAPGVQLETLLLLLLLLLQKTLQSL